MACRKLCAVVVVGLSAGQAARGQMPFMENLIYTSGPDDVMTSVDWTEIPGTARMVNVPVGEAFIVYSVTGSGTGFEIRPVIGGAAPGQGVFIRPSGYNTAAHSWVTTTTGGEILVKLEGRLVREAEFTMDNRSQSWTLLVFPQTLSSVPAVGGLGLVAIVVVLLAAGGVVLSRKEKARQLRESTSSNQATAQPHGIDKS